MKNDSKIQSDIIQELKWDPSVIHEKIGVSVSDGIATLSGSVPNFLQKSAAERAAQRVAGVKAVVEKIEVRLPGSSKRDDQDLAKAILNQFRWTVQVPDELIKANVENGWVELTGEVEWDFQRNAAETCVRSLTGVKGVTNNIGIMAKRVEAAAIKQKIEEALKREAEREARRISVEVDGSKVILSGKVHSFAELEDARWAAWSAVGVTNVINNLRIG